MHNTNVLKKDEIQVFLKLLSSVKGTVSSHFSPSFIVVKNVFDANMQVLLLLFLRFPVYATDITGTICISFLLLCFTFLTHQNMHKKK